MQQHNSHVLRFTHGTSDQVWIDGRAAYEADVAEVPTWGDGRPRTAWDELSLFAKERWCEFAIEQRKLELRSNGQSAK